MNEGGLFCLRAEDAVRDLGAVYSTSEESLRVLGAAYMRDPKTIGSLVLHGPDFAVIAVFDVWTDDWREAGQDGKPASQGPCRMVG